MRCLGTGSARHAISRVNGRCGERRRDKRFGEGGQASPNRFLLGWSQAGDRERTYPGSARICDCERVSGRSGLRMGPRRGRAHKTELRLIFVLGGSRIVDDRAASRFLSWGLSTYFAVSHLHRLSAQLFHDCRPHLVPRGRCRAPAETSSGLGRSVFGSVAWGPCPWAIACSMSYRWPGQPRAPSRVVLRLIDVTGGRRDVAGRCHVIHLFCSTDTDREAKEGNPLPRRGKAPGNAPRCVSDRSLRTTRFFAFSMTTLRPEGP